MHRDDTECERDDGSYFDEGGKIIARREQQPNRQDRGEKSIADDPDRESGRFHHEVVPDTPSFDVAATEYRKADERDAEYGTFDEAAGAQMGHVDADEHRDWHGRGDGRGCPRAMLHRVDHDQAEHRD